MVHRNDEDVARRSLNHAKKKKEKKSKGKGQNGQRGAGAESSLF